MKNIRCSNPNDNELLHILTESLPMEGDFSLRIERKPDFFALLKKRGESKTYVSTYNDLIEGSISVSKKEYFLQGKPHLSGIISDVKFLNRRNTTNFARLLQYTHEQIIKNKLDHLFVTIADGNTRIKHVLSGRVGLPKFYKISNFDILQFLSKKRPSKHQNVEQADRNQSDTILSFYKKYLQGFDVANSPVSIDPAIEADYFIKKNGKIVAAIRLMDTTHLKQNVLLRAPITIRVALKLLRLLKKPIGLPKIPKIGMPVDILYIRYYALEKGHFDDLVELIDHARHKAYLKGLTFLSMAICRELEILKPIKKHFFHLTFKSSLYQAHSKSKEPVKFNDKMLCFEDYAVV